MQNLTSFQLMRAERCVTRWFNRQLAATGLTLSQLYLLWTINNNEGSSVTDIAAEFGCDRSTITRNLSRLKGLVVERLNKFSKVAKHVSLSDSGKKLLKSSVKQVKRLDKGIQEGLYDGLEAHQAFALDDLHAFLDCLAKRYGGPKELRGE